MIHVFVRPLWIGIRLQCNLLDDFSFQLVLLLLCCLRLLCPILLVPLFLNSRSLIFQKLLELAPPDGINFSSVFFVRVWIYFI